MLLELARWLQGLEDFFGLFGYLTFRGILAALTSLFLSLWWGPAVIRRLGQLKGGQPIRKDGPQSHFSKAGTPTMGGALILLTILASVLLWGDLRNKYVWTVLLVMVAFGAIGWYDDWIKIVRRDPNGLKSRWKYLLQSIFGLAAGLYLWFFADVPAATTFYLPLFKSIALPLGGIGFVAIAMGVFGYGEIIANLSRPDEAREVFSAKVQGLLPTREDFRRMTPAILRGTALGSVLGVLPGGGALLAAFAAYTVEKKTRLKTKILFSKVSKLSSFLLISKPPHLSQIPGNFGLVFSYISL